VSKHALPRTLVAAAIVLTALLAGVPPAAGGNDTQCVGVFAGPADNVVVPSGDTCFLEGAVIHGNVLAEPHSMLFIGPATTIRGNVEVKDAAHTAAFMSTIGGNYKCDNCFFEDVVQSAVGGSVQVTGADDGVFVENSTVSGNIEIVESSSGLFAFVIGNTFVGGNVKFEKNIGPVLIGAGGPFLNNTILGDLQIYENNVEGAFCPPEAPPQECPFFQDGVFNNNTVGGDMQLYKNRGETEVTGNVIRENLQCFDNVPPPASAGNVAQQRQGQCLA
jgi:hypothetical protein